MPCDAGVADGRAKSVRAHHARAGGTRHRWQLVSCMADGVLAKAEMIAHAPLPEHEVRSGSRRRALPRSPCEHRRPNALTLGRLAERGRHSCVKAKVRRSMGAPPHQLLWSGRDNESFGESVREMDMSAAELNGACSHSLLPGGRSARPVKGRAVRRERRRD